MTCPSCRVRHFLSHQKWSPAQHVWTYLYSDNIHPVPNTSDPPASAQWFRRCAGMLSEQTVPQDHIHLRTRTVRVSAVWSHPVNNQALASAFLIFRGIYPASLISLIKDAIIENLIIQFWLLSDKREYVSLPLEWYYRALSLRIYQNHCCIPLNYWSR